MAQNLDIPIDVPWSLVAASPDMMDTTFCDGGFPPAWRSSLAISAYEPSPNDLPKQLCNQKITYLKVTCSITGFQPTARETAELSGHTPTDAQPPGTGVATVLPGGNVAVALPDVPVDIAEDLLSSYFACYGVLLNVAVFPSTTTILQATSTAEQYAFTGQKSKLPNPFIDGGLQFSSSRTEDLLLTRTSPRGAFALSIESTRLQIDLPISKSVLLKMSVPSSVNVIVTAYQRNAVVFTTNVATTNGVKNIPIDTSHSVTQIIIQARGYGACLLAGLNYNTGERSVTLSDYPHIIDFEPKTRDLYQAATDQSEILTGSNSSVNTGKSLSNTSSSEMGMGLSGGYSSGSNAGPNVTGQLTGKWGNTTSDSSATQADQSRERRETQGATTNITQQYNLLTGYHAGTNRAAFLMLPRPHTLQATDYRTFIAGLRMIEGVQEFLLIVSRPTILPGICIEASLETGHFPETVVPILPKPPAPPTQTFPFSVGARVPGSTATSPTQTAFTLTLPDPWIIDTSVSISPDPRAIVAVSPNILGVSSVVVSLPSIAPGVFYTYSPIAGQTTDSDEYKQAVKTLGISATSVSESSIGGSIWLTGAGLSGGETDADLQLLFTVHATQKPQLSLDAEPIVVGSFLVTSRELCVCINSCASNDCVMIAPPQQIPYSQSTGPIDGGGNSASGGETTKVTAAAKALSVRATPTAAAIAPPPTSGTTPIKEGKHVASSRSSIVYEAKLKLRRQLLNSMQAQNSRTPAARELMHQIQHHMLASWRLPQRRAHGAVGFLDCDYVCERLTSRLPQAHLSREIGDVNGLPQGVIKALGAKITVSDVLKLDLHRLRTLAKVELEDAISIRRKLLGFV